MYELQDNAGRLIVVLPMRMKHKGSIVCVFVDGHCVGEHKTVGEATKHAKTLADRGPSDPSESAV